MAITTVNAVWYGSAGTGGAGSVSGTNQIIATATGAGTDAKIVRGHCLPIQDGSTASFTVNWIDGTKTLLYPPDNVLAFTYFAPAWQGSVSGGDAGENASLGPPYSTPFINYYNVGDVVDGVVSATHYVFKATTGGAAGSTTPTWATTGSITDGSVVWTNAGQIASTAVYVQSVSAVTSTSALVTLSGNGTSTYAALVGLVLQLH